MRNPIRVLTLTGLALVLACGGGSGGQDGDAMAQPTQTSDEITIVYENQQYTDCTVYFEGSVGRRRLGRVTGNSTGRFRAPASPTGFVIVAEYQAIGSVRTPEILADPGQVVTITSATTGNLTYTIR